MNINPKLLFLLFPLWVNASPWLETNDPFIRADLQLLADAGLLDAPINHYPLRWATFSDDIRNKDSEPSASFAQKHINYMLMSAKVQRGKKYAKTVIGSSPPSATGFGQTNKDEWGVYAGYENMFEDFSFRINSGYSKYATDNGSEQDFVWNDSYLALNAGKFLLTVGAIDRWWGPSWQHNLSFANYGQSNPSISINYLGDQLPMLGYWSLETVFEFLESDFEYLSSTRLIIKPLRFLELGATYQMTEKDDMDNSLNQYGLDGRLSLPSFSNLYHGLFASFTSFDYEQQNSAHIIGWDGQFNIYENSVRIVLEKQSVDESEFKKFTDKQRYQHKEINSLQWGNSLSLAFYLQFINDHKMSLIYRDSEGSSYYQEQSLQLDYRFPLSIGQFHLGLGQSDVIMRSSKNSETNFWSGYELRF
ncbi:capsule assembly Wzi family protein [Psychromonas sp. Urea-02u-13]|uniref:capsule assembly Wzi family protein n=1 Tax=Psychromonas sp. Urea-02u-13 TaxID=2058326 RepID=UPI000C31CC5E|nr:capsule assembly Wzi family protein [Psychromonas sp. Urea-02u-13]PKG37506.1 hypothetical protein CXF74_18500 [Psychromonas sp. Urea-02u-13]